MPETSQSGARVASASRTAATFAGFVDPTAARANGSLTSGSLASGPSAA